MKSFFTDLGFCSRNIFKYSLPTSLFFSPRDMDLSSPKWDFQHPHASSVLSLIFFKSIHQYSKSSFVTILGNIFVATLGSFMTLFFYRHQCIVAKQYKLSRKKSIFGILLLFFAVICLNFTSLELSQVDPSLWPELLRKVCLLL
uniref:7TM_GPCR_Srx domain-containing protein n=1 Tax=Heterorhabditis bacteriophora TaxID=37862 RepID=A0A1I7WEK0_HETBA